MGRSVSNNKRCEVSPGDNENVLKLIVVLRHNSKNIQRDDQLYTLNGKFCGV